MDTLQLLHSLKSEQETGKMNADMSFVSNSDYSDISQSVEEEVVPKVVKQEVNVKKEPPEVDIKENLPVFPNQYGFI